MAIVEVQGLARDYTLGPQTVQALRGVTFSVEAGEFVSVMGPSGSGKSTLLHLLGGLDTPSAGKVTLEGRDLSGLDDEELTTLRRTKIGFVFQFFNLLPTMTAWENVALPRLLGGERLRDLRERAVGLLDRVGLAERADHKPAQLSGGEMQRVAIARSLVGDPVLVLADEPTGNLDSKSGEGVLTLLRSLVDAERMTLIVVTHDPKAAGMGDRILGLKDGLLESDAAVGGSTR
jgi:putative ABC transport system ATP-binding protein